MKSGLYLGKCVYIITIERQAGVLPAAPTISVN